MRAIHFARLDCMHAAAGGLCASFPYFMARPHLSISKSGLALIMYTIPYQNRMYICNVTDLSDFIIDR